jgi:hypothetical protein
MYIDKIVKTCILVCVCIIEFVVVLFKMSCNALSVVSGTCLYIQILCITELVECTCMSIFRSSPRMSVCISLFSSHLCFMLR